MALQDFSIDTSGSPQEVQRKQALADALMKQGMDSSAAAGGKNGGWITALNRGLAGALGGYQRGAATDMEQQGRAHFQQVAANLMGADGKVNQQAFLQASGDPWANQQTLGAVGKVQDWQHTAERDKVGDQHTAFSERLANSADSRAAAAERRAADEDENTPYRYAKNPLFGQPGQPEYFDRYAQAAAAGEASVPGTGKASLNPVYGVGADGKPAMVQTTPSGKAIQTELPTGFQIAKDPIKIDNGTHWTLLDPQTRQVVGQQPKNLAAVEVQKAGGEATGAAQVALPSAIATANQTLKTIEEMKTHPGLDHSVGAWSVVPNIPGSAGADFAAKAAQLKGQTFIQAFASLKGAGAITDIEGKKGEDAIAALDRAQSKAQYIKSLNELRDVIQGGMLRAHAKANGPGSSMAQTPADTAPQTAPDPLGIR